MYSLFSQSQRLVSPVIPIIKVALDPGGGFQILIVELVNQGLGCSGPAFFQRTSHSDRREHLYVEHMGHPVLSDVWRDRNKHCSKRILEQS